MAHKIIVTGGCGYIGSHTAIELIKSGFNVVIFDDFSNSSKKTIERIYQITGTAPTLINVDLKDADETHKAFLAHYDAEGVIHFAAHKAVGESVEKPLMYYKNNLYSLLNTLESQSNLNINKFIFSSSATVYGTPETLPITEENETQRPFSPYGNTKKMAEEILDDFTKSNKSFSAISLRYFNPIGAHESGKIGELPNGIPNNLMPYITQTAAGIREKLMVYGNDYPTKDGTPIRDYIHVIDLAKAHVIAIKRLINNKQETSLEFFNLGTGIGYSVLDVIHTFESATKCKLNYEITERRDGDVPQLYASTDLAKVKLGWTATKNLEDMISSSWTWEQNLRNENN
ncbi:UDP-glucose 4-epimerase GalE [Winogradskyella thalassocola]|uniref:UDP-glucose 4-epimerase n=1 Tax=Winogradskyella thalassocola TaxID=262004 RepID=A0A1G7WGI0_9FLAO|nr:UDP-glucose 4-epimerase GalE [Winogradskyella thalassocola]SDG71137.1 UDP-galactose 4-epimerase [Winogradskyella thalassocola]